MVTPLVCALVPLALSVGAQPQDSLRPGATALVEQARQYLPKIEGDQKPLLSPDEERDTRAATKIFEAALALEPENAYALWWHGYGAALIAENERNRGRDEAARELYDVALASFAATLEHDPRYYWAHYSRAMALANLGRFDEAIESFDGAVRVANEIMEQNTGDDWAPFVRFKARQWRADTRLRNFQFDLAREELVSFYADNGNNQWDLGYSMADAHLRESDLAGARAAYGKVIENPEFDKFDSSFAELAYIAGLLDEREEAVKRIRQALEKEFQASLYPRLWLWILADGEVREKAAADLAEFLEYPPDGLSEWDLTLGRFVIAGSDIGAFIEAAEAERDRRMAAGEALDNLMCEVWFYAGVWDERAGRDAEALGAYRLALAFRPAKHKWEWSYARKRFAALAARQGLDTRPGFSVDGTTLTLPADDPLNPGPLTGTLERFTLHHAGDPQPSTPTALDPTTLRPGDLLRCTLRDSTGAAHALRIVVDAQ